MDDPYSKIQVLCIQKIWFPDYNKGPFPCLFALESIDSLTAYVISQPVMTQNSFKALTTILTCRG